MNIFKKLLAVFLVCVLVFGLAACGEPKIERDSAGVPHLTVPAKQSKAGKIPAWVETGKVARAYITYEYTGVTGKTQSVDRYFYYYIPTTFDANQPPALMMTLHGSGVNADWQMREGSFKKLAEKEGFVVLAPESTEVAYDSTLYADGRGLTALKQSDYGAVRFVAGDFEMASPLGVDDVAYLSDLIDLFAAGNLIDAGRVYISGLSHGAYMSVRMAIEASDKVAGIGVVAGQVLNMFENRELSSQVKAVFIQGTADTTVPMRGQNYGGFPFSMSTDDSAEWFYKKNGHKGEPVIVEEPLEDKEVDGTTITRYAYMDGSEEVVVKYIVENGDHNWPGGTLGSAIGRRSKDASATELIWNDLKDVRK